MADRLGADGLVVRFESNGDHYHFHLRRRSNRRFAILQNDLNGKDGPAINAQSL